MSRINKAKGREVDQGTHRRHLGYAISAATTAPFLSASALGELTPHPPLVYSVDCGDDPGVAEVGGDPDIQYLSQSSNREAMEGGSGQPAQNIRIGAPSISTEVPQTSPMLDPLGEFFSNSAVICPCHVKILDPKRKIMTLSYPHMEDTVVLNAKTVQKNAYERRRCEIKFQKGVGITKWKAWVTGFS